jgi:hypothetical protein
MTFFHFFLSLLSSQLYEAYNNNNNNNDDDDNYYDYDNNHHSMAYPSVWFVLNKSFPVFLQING